MTIGEYRDIYGLEMRRLHERVEPDDSRLEPGAATQVVGGTGGSRHRYAGDNADLVVG
jgi:hypothetical protein